MNVTCKGMPVSPISAVRRPCSNCTCRRIWHFCLDQPNVQNPNVRDQCVWSCIRWCCLLGSTDYNGYVLMTICVLRGCGKYTDGFHEPIGAFNQQQPRGRVILEGHHITTLYVSVLLKDSDWCILLSWNCGGLSGTILQRHLSYIDLVVWLVSSIFGKCTDGCQHM